MGVLHWRGQATAVAEVITVTIGGTLSSEDFKLGLGDPTAGGKWIAEHTDATTIIEDTVDALIAAWNASTHPWATGITATKSGTTMIVLTADVAGVPFGTYMSDVGQTWETGVRGYHEIDLNTPGGAATLTQDETTANRGPNCANVAANYNTGAYPANGDDLHIKDGGVDIKWGLDFRTDSTYKVTLDSLTEYKSFTGKIGLDYATFDGITTAHEYRDTYFGILVDGTAGDVRIGEPSGGGGVAGSQRVMLDLRGIGSTLVMLGSSAQSYDTGRPAVRVLIDEASGDSYCHVRAAPGGFGIAMDQPGETSTLGRLIINCESTKDKVYTGAGLTLSDGSIQPFQMTGGFCRFRHVPSADGTANKIFKMQVDGGELWTEGDFCCGYFRNEGAHCYLNHYSTDSGSQYAIQEALFKNGTTNTRRSLRNRNWDVAKDWPENHKLLMYEGVITVTTWQMYYEGGVVGA